MTVFVQQQVQSASHLIRRQFKDCLTVILTPWQLTVVSSSKSNSSAHDHSILCDKIDRMYEITRHRRNARRQTAIFLRDL